MTVHHEPCPKCGSSDGLAVYDDDGHAHCFVCDAHWHSYTGETTGMMTAETETKGFLTGHYEHLTARKITEETCRKFEYQLGEDHYGKPVQIANYRDALGVRVCQKIRDKDKNFYITGHAKDMPLYGQSVWGQGGKYVTITEGEIDALSMSQAMNNKWAVVSLPNGTKSTTQALGNALDWLNTFDNIVLCFDMDEPGRQAIEDAVKVLPIGKVKIMSLPEKDANAVLVKQGPAVLVDCFWKAKDYRPDGIVSGKEITREFLKSKVATGIELPWPILNQRMMRLRKRELTLLTAGTGIGKSTLAREMAYYLHQHHNQSIGNVFLEEGVDKTAQAYVAMHHNKNIKDVRSDPTILSDAAWDKALNEVLHERMFFYDHFGSLDADTLIMKLRYMATVEKVGFIILDHISIVVSGMESTQGERKDIDVFMTKLRSLIEETGVGVIAIVHLSQPLGKAHEEGARVTLRQLRGSGSLKQFADNVIALERNQQSKNHQTVAQMRVLKCRETGETGPADLINYDRQTGRYEVVSGFEVDIDEAVDEEEEKQF
jgi:twinkle protein